MSKRTEKELTYKPCKKAKEDIEGQKKHRSYSTKRSFSDFEIDFVVDNKIKDKLSYKVAAISMVNVKSKILISY